MSVATASAAKFGTKLPHEASADSVCATGQYVMAGAVVSFTWNVTLCWTELLLPSATVMVTVVAPRPTNVPAVGDCVTVTPVQLSVATTCEV